jgi:iron(III) transport system substrate-binding protein
MRTLPALALGLVLAACGAGEPPAAVVVYVPASLEQALQERLAGSPFDIKLVTGEGGTLTNRVIDKRDVPRADVLVTSNAHDIWRAAERGALRPIESADLGALPAGVRDPDRLWAAIDVRWHRILLRDAAGPIVSSLDALGTDDFRGRLCLSSSALPVNRSLLAFLIEARGVREAERLVRRWVGNLARPPFASEAELLAVLRDGTCDVGIASSMADGEGMIGVNAEPATLDIVAIGIGRHAADPEAAQRLVEWLLARRRFELADGDVAFVGIAGWRADEARLLAERAGYR